MPERFTCRIAKLAAVEPTEVETLLQETLRMAKRAAENDDEKALSAATKVLVQFGTLSIREARLDGADDLDNDNDDIVRLAKTLAS